MAELAEAHPELAPAVALEREILEGERRLQRRIGTPWVDVPTEQLGERLARGERLIDLDQLAIDWSELRLRIRQVVDVLRRHDVLEHADAARLHTAGRDGHPAGAGAPVVRRSAGRRRRDDLVDPLLGRRARRWRRVRSSSALPKCCTSASSVDGWTRGTCPMCGATPSFALIPATGTRLLVCGRCHCRWAFAARTCHRCLASNRLRVVLGARRPLPGHGVRRLQAVPEGARRAARRRVRC